MKLECSRQILEKYSNFIQIRPVGAELFRADRHTNRHDEANICFSLFWHTPETLRCARRV